MVKTFGVEHLSEGSGVLDIAGGRGDLSFALMFTHHVTSSTLIDPVGSTLALLFHHLQHGTELPAWGFFFSKLLSDSRCQF